MFISSLLDERYKWFYNDLVQSNQLHLMLIEDSNFEQMLGFFRTACIQLQLKKEVVVSLSESLIALKDFLCICPEKQGASIIPDMSRQLSLNESLEQDSRFEIFIEKFFELLSKNRVLQQTQVFESEEARQELIARVANILHCQNLEDDFEIDQEGLQQHE